MTVQLEVLPEYKTHKIVVGTSLRKPLPVLQAYLASLDWQEKPEHVEFLYAFVNDGLAEDAKAFVDKWLQERNGTWIRGIPAGMPDFADVSVDSHQWSGSAMHRVGQNKNRILKHALQNGAEGAWLADADLIMDRTTFGSLWALEAPIATAVYWTHWTRRGTETRKIHAAPQVWLRHPYGLEGRGFDEATFRQRLLDRQLVKVPGYGACTLIRRQALEADANFDYLPDVPLVGLMAGEDRHFCLRAERLHIPALADPWPDIFHIYHLPEDAEQIPTMAGRLARFPLLRPHLGCLVSLRLQPLEPVPHSSGWTMLAPQYIRGRLGALVLMPELEEAVYGMNRCTELTIPVHFPTSHPVAYYRGKRRLIRVKLVDCKFMGFPPVVENELLIGASGKHWLDTTTLDERLENGIREMAYA